MEYSINFNGALLPRRITFPLPDSLSIENGFVTALRTSLYKSIIKQIDLYERMSSSPSVSPTGMLNTPVFSDITLKSTSNEQLYITLDTVLATISQSKIIQRTKINGKNGSVKEYYSLDDFEITLKGSLCDDNPTRYPFEKVELLRKLLELPEAIKISGPLFELFKIFNVVVSKYSFDQKPGAQNNQFFDITLYSDLPVELQTI